MNFVSQSASPRFNQRFLTVPFSLNLNMQIFVNGEAREVPESTSMAALVERMELTGRRIAVEVNEELVSRSEFEQFSLSDGDKIEIIHAVGGG